MNITETFAYLSRKIDATVRGEQDFITLEKLFLRASSYDISNFSKRITSICNAMEGEMALERGVNNGIYQDQLSQTTLQSLNVVKHKFDTLGLRNLISLTPQFFTSPNVNYIKNSLSLIKPLHTLTTDNYYLSIYNYDEVSEICGKFRITNVIIASINDFSKPLMLFSTNETEVIKQINIDKNLINILGEHQTYTINKDTLLPSGKEYHDFKKSEQILFWYVSEMRKLNQSKQNPAYKKLAAYSMNFFQSRANDEQLEYIMHSSSSRNADAYVTALNHPSWKEADNTWACYEALNEVCDLAKEDLAIRQEILP